MMAVKDPATGEHKCIKCGNWFYPNSKTTNTLCEGCLEDRNLEVERFIDRQRGDIYE